MFYTVSDLLTARLSLGSHDQEKDPSLHPGLVAVYILAELKNKQKQTKKTIIEIISQTVVILWCENVTLGHFAPLSPPSR